MAKRKRGESESDSMHESQEGESALESMAEPLTETRDQKKLRLYEEMFRKKEEQELKK